MLSRWMATAKEESGVGPEKEEKKIWMEWINDGVNDEEKTMV